VIPTLIPVFIIIPISEYSDKSGRRKMFIVIALTGRLLFSIMMTFKSMEIFIQCGSLFSLMYTVTLPSALFGGHVFVMCMCFSHLSDITTLKQRTTRIIVANAIYFSTIPFGVLLGSFLYDKRFQSSYTLMFAINTLFVALSILWTLWRVNDVNHPDETDLKSQCDQTHLGWRAFKYHRIENNSMKKFLLLLAMLFLYELQHDEKPYSYLYTQLIFGWTHRDFSYFRSFQSALFVVTMITLWSAIFRITKINHEITMIAFATASHIAARVIYIFAAVGWVFYLGALAGAAGTLAASVLRSMISKLVNSRHTGKTFSFMFLCEKMAPLIGTVVYSQMYYQTVDNTPAAFFIFTLVTQTLLLSACGLLKKWYPPSDSGH